MATVTGAVALSLRVVRVTFSAALADATALILNNWALACLGTPPFFVPTIVSIVGVDSQTNPSAIDITVDQEFSPGLLYSATPSGVTGLSGTGLFYAVVPPQFADREFALIDFVPIVNKHDDTSGQMTNFISCLQEVLTLSLADSDRWQDILDPDLAPVDFVEAMLADLGNPFNFVPDLTLNQRRKLAKLLVAIYQLKGSAQGIEQAIRLLLGFDSQILTFFGAGIGALVGSTSPSHPLDTLGSSSPAHTGTFFLGGGAPYEIYFRVATTPIGNGLGPNGYGRTLSPQETDIITEILDVMKPAHVVLKFIRTGLPKAVRATIRDTGAGSIEITCLGIIQATIVSLWERSSPGANDLNGLMRATIAGVYTATPGGTFYWTGTGTNASITDEGLVSGEVTNALATPVLTATAGVRKVTLSWPAISGATAYRIYKSLASHASPAQADNAADPIQIYADVSTYVDTMESGDSFFYMVTGVVDLSEGFFSNEQSATAL